MMTTKNPMLIIEDDANLGETLQMYFEGKDIPVHLATSATQAKEIFKKLNLHHDPQIPLTLLMDVGLPDGDGISLAKEFYAEKKGPIIILFFSALNDPDVRVEALEIGAHDFINKPFALKELTLRLERIQKSYQQNGFEQSHDVVHLGPLKIEFSKFQMTDAHGEVMTLTQKEWAILKLLWEKKNHVVARDVILDAVWGQDVFPSNRTVDNYMVKLRKWCESDPSKKTQIQSIRGVGYKLQILE
jgi:two-component system alkaline phosphatase synthesis response regulator PhoP